MNEFDNSPFRPGDTFVNLCDPGRIIYGKVITAKEAAAQGFTLVATTMKICGVHATTCFCQRWPRGLVGATHEDYMAHISKRDFHRAELRGWPDDAWFLSGILPPPQPSLLNPDRRYPQPGE